MRGDPLGSSSNPYHILRGAIGRVECDGLPVMIAVRSSAVELRLPEGLEATVKAGRLGETIVEIGPAKKFKRLEVNE